MEMISDATTMDLALQGRLFRLISFFQTLLKLFDGFSGHCDAMDTMIAAITPMNWIAMCPNHQNWLVKQMNSIAVMNSASRFMSCAVSMSMLS